MARTVHDTRLCPCRKCVLENLQRHPNNREHAGRHDEGQDRGPDQTDGPDTQVDGIATGRKAERDPRDSTRTAASHRPPMIAAIDMGTSRRNSGLTRGTTSPRTGVVRVCRRLSLMGSFRESPCSEPVRTRRKRGKVLAA